MPWKSNRFLNAPATPGNIRAYLIEAGVPAQDLDLVDIEAYADPTVSVKEVLPSLVEAHPFLRFYVTVPVFTGELGREAFEVVRALLDKAMLGVLDKEDRELLEDTFSTTDPIVIITLLWASDAFPPQKILELVEDLRIPLDSLPARVRRSLERVKSLREISRPLPLVRKTEEHPLLPLIESVRERLKAIMSTINREDIKHPPLIIDYETAKKNLVGIVAYGTPQALRRLAEIIEKHPDIEEQLMRLEDAINILSRYEATGRITEEGLKVVQEFFPRTAREIKKSLERLPKPSPFPVYTHIGTKKLILPTGRVVEQEYAEIRATFEAMYNVYARKYGEDRVLRAIEYVKTRYAVPPESPYFWSTVESVLREGKV